MDRVYFSTVETVFLSKNEIQQGAELLKQGELVAFPTETVYGLGASIFSPQTIQKIFEVKGRPQDNPLIAHIANLSQASLLAKDLPETFTLLAGAYFPGPLTLVVEKSEKVPDIATAGLPTIGIRMPNQQTALALIEAVGEPLVAPSANLSGLPSSTTAAHVMDDFEGKIAAVLDGGSCYYGIESTVLDLVSFERPTLLRPGAISKRELEETLSMPVDLYTTGPKSSPGMKYRHYSPSIPVSLHTTPNALEAHLTRSKNPYLIHELASQSLYHHLRFADENGYDEVVIYCDHEIDDALNNRLEKILCENSCH